VEMSEGDAGWDVWKFRIGDASKSWKRVVDRAKI